ncbi:universal stress protein, partial [Pyxidicoccus sp. 3LG]
LVVVGRPRRPDTALKSARERVVGGLFDRVSRMVLVAVGCPPRAYRRPLVAVDLSEGAHRAVQRALLLAPGATRLTVVHSFDASYELVLHFSGARASQEVAYLRAAEVRAREALHAWTAPYRETGLQVDEVVLPGEPAETLLAAATEYDSDLIVLRRHSRAGLGRVVRPHVARQVVRDSRCDVLVLEPEPEPEPVGASRQ